MSIQSERAAMIYLHKINPDKYLLKYKKFNLTLYEKNETLSAMGMVFWDEIHCLDGRPKISEFKG